MDVKEFTQSQQINHHITGLYLIEASAGTGKTYTISNLFLRHIALGRSVSEILVVTFTIAATDELKGRIRRRLYEAYQSIKNNNQDDIFLNELISVLDKNNQDKLINRLDLALRSMDESAIYTIHGFCQKALTDFAFLSGQAYQQELNNNKDDWLNPVVLDWWRINVATQKDDIKFHNYDQLGWTDYTKFKKFYDRVAEKQVIINPNKAWSGFASKLQSLYLELCNEWQKQNLAEGLIQLSCFPINSKLFKNESLLIAKSRLDSYFAKESFSYLPAETVSFSLSNITKALKKAFSEDDLPKTIFFKMVDEITEIYNQQKDIFLAESLRQAKAYISEQSQKLKKQKQLFSFQDLLINLQQALYGEQGDELAKAIRQKYSIAFIDEFQDTDPIQYNIFNKLYFGQEKTTLYMIGDPKQAIYSFRGGDIYTYIQAKSDLKKLNGKIYTLNTNWRSTPEMITAINNIFAKRGNDAFLYKDIIPFSEVYSPTKEQNPSFNYLTLEDKKQQPLNFWVLEKEQKSVISKEKANKLIDHNVTNEIVKLLALAKQGKAKLGTNKLQASDVAILVPTHIDAQRLQKQLHKKGVQSVVASNTSVFKSEQAQPLFSLLVAILDYKNHNAQRQALACSLINLNYQQIHQLINNETEWANWCKSLKTLNTKWSKQGFMPMFMSMINLLKIDEGLKNSGKQDRALTNLMHLAELIQQAAKKHSTMEDLKNWYSKQLDKTENEEAEIRLESDANLVKITTLHTSKGLEYGVVFLPYLWGLKIVQPDVPMYHQSPENLLLECDSEKQKQAQIKADYERLAEHLRLVYVALTRSVACCYVAWGDIYQANKSALAYLLHSNQNPEDLQNKPATNTSIKDNQKVKEDIKNLNKDGLISFKYIKPQPDNYLAKQDKTQNKYSNKAFTGTIERTWKINSFSKLTAHLDHSSRIDTDTNTKQGFDNIFDFPAGIQTGNYLHEMLEKISFSEDLDEQIDKLNETLLNKYAIDENQISTIKNWLNQIINTQFGEEGLSLKNIQPQNQLAEMAFSFSCDQVSIQKLNTLLKTYAPKDFKPIDNESFKGLVNGIIDLVFEYKGKYYLADYKSNLLGRTLVCYTPENMAKEINHRRYDLQYLIYSIALERYCQSRIPNYSYKEHFGGVYYLFLRAMREETANQYGSYFIRPDEEYMYEFKSLFKQ